MKIQDIGFIAFFVVLIIVSFWKKDFRLISICGIIMLLLSIPLFSMWVFFTAERLVWYAALCFFCEAILFFLDKSAEQ